MIEEEKGKKK